jgi:hypothetical protein
MGVRRLTTFIDRCSGLVEMRRADDKSPKAGPVVIDAMGFIFHVLTSLDSPGGNPLWLHLGPDADISAIFMKYMHAFKMSFSSILVIFDGVNADRTNIRRDRMNDVLPHCQSAATFLSGSCID